MKKYRKTLTVFIILIVAILMFASFFGVYIRNKSGKQIKLIPDYKLGMEFEDKRVITAKVNHQVMKTVVDAEGKIVKQEDGVEYKEEDGYKTYEIPVNTPESKTLENYKKTKEIIKERLEKNKISEFSIYLNEESGIINITIPEDSNADAIESIIKSTGGFIMRDTETKEVVFDNDYFKKAEVMYNQVDFGTIVFLQIEFNEEGKAKLNELNNIYVETTTTETNEEGKEEEVTKSKLIELIINGYSWGDVVLSNFVYEDKIMLPLDIAYDNSDIQAILNEAQAQAILLNSGSAPVVYEYSSEVEKSNITPKIALVFMGAIGAIFVLAYIYLIIKFKANGFISIYFQVGFLGILLMILRLTNVIITIEGMAGIVISMVLEYIFTYIVLTNLKKGEEGMYKKSNLTFFLNTFPLYVVAVILTFAVRAHINSFGMTLFWGIIMIYVYNFIFSKFVFENLKSGGQNENS